MRPRTGVLAAGVLVVAACGGPSGQDPKAYVHSICTAYATFEAQLTTAASSFTAAQTAAQTDPTKIKTAATAFLGTEAGATATLLAAITAQRRPSGQGGDAVRTGFVHAADQAHTIFVQQQQAVAAAPPTPVSFFQVLDTAQKQVTTAGQDLQTGIENIGAVGDRTINEAISADSTCSGL